MRCHAMQAAFVEMLVVAACELHTLQSAGERLRVVVDAKTVVEATRSLVIERLLSAARRRNGLSFRRALFSSHRLLDATAALAAQLTPVHARYCELPSGLGQRELDLSEGAAKGDGMQLRRRRFLQLARDAGLTGYGLAEAEAAAAFDSSTPVACDDARAEPALTDGHDFHEAIVRLTAAWQPPPAMGSLPRGQQGMQEGHVPGAFSHADESAVLAKLPYVVSMCVHASADRGHS